MATLGEVQTAVAGALMRQRYRELAVAQIDTAPVHLPGPGSFGNAVLDDALVGLTETPNWGEIGRQVSLFRQNRGYWSAYVRRDQKDLEMVVAQHWSTPLGGDFLNSQLDFEWGNAKSCGELFHSFKLSDRTREAFAKLIATFGTSSTGGDAGAAPNTSASTTNPLEGTEDNDTLLQRVQSQMVTVPWKQPLPSFGQPAPPAPTPQVAWDQVALRLLLLVASFLWDVHDATTLNVVLMPIAQDGLAPDGVGYLEAWRIKSEAWASITPVGIDAPNVQAHGHTTQNSLDVGRLGRDMRYLLGVA
jgi:hypothetical protein